MERASSVPRATSPMTEATFSPRDARATSTPRGQQLPRRTGAPWRPWRFTADARTQSSLPPHAGGPLATRHDHAS